MITATSQQEMKVAHLRSAKKKPLARCAVRDEVVGVSLR
jgi:hypothetical protein